MRPLLALLFALTLSSPAQAGDRDHSGLTVGAATAGGALGGALVLGAAGGGLGVLGCRISRGPECFLPLVGAGAGAGAGVLIGGPLGGALGARATHHSPRRVLAFTAAGGGLALGLTAAGWATGWAPLRIAGLGTAVVGMPVLAGIAVKTDPGQGPTVRLAPQMLPQGAGIELQVRGF